MTLDEKLAAIVPHKRQVKFQQLEFYAFIHFTVNTFTDIDDDYDEFFTAPKGKSTAEITALWKEPVCLGNIVIKENILCGQRVEAFTIEVKTDGEYRKIYSGTVIGYKRIVPLNNVITDSVRISITDSRTEPTISFLGIYKGE